MQSAKPPPAARAPRPHRYCAAHASRFRLWRVARYSASPKAAAGAEAGGGGAVAGVPAGVAAASAAPNCCDAASRRGLIILLADRLLQPPRNWVPTAKARALRAAAVAAAVAAPPPPPREAEALAPALRMGRCRSNCGLIGIMAAKNS
jgi:hypothetical protein